MRYSVKVICRRGNNYEWQYNEREEAIARIEVVKNQPSLCKVIEVLRVALLNNATQTVERILVYADGKLQEDLYDGQMVQLIDEEDYIYKISNIHEDIGSCLITCLNSKLSLAPCMQVDIESVCNVFAGKGEGNNE